MLRALLALLIILAAGVAWRMLRVLTRPPPAARGDGKVRMVKCAVCDLYVPENEAETDGGRFYCGPSHRLIGGGGERK
ncbi:MAG: hypothetical protein HYY48_07610 [Gammaproteobacteria bacterium]|nr:hypothetical protein [Gammaproteobacteria bacterium]